MSDFAPLDRVEVAHAVAATDHFVLTGTDALNLLHRISASEVRGLALDESRHFIFTDDKGALVDAPLVTPSGRGIRVVTGPGRGEALRTWIDKWIIVDDVRIDPAAEPALRLGEPGLGGNAPSVLTPATKAGPAILVGDSELDAVDLDQWEAMNFQAGRLYSGPATSSGPIPLELGWKNLIAFDKGCYIGQEVIARLDTYDKVRRGLSIAKLGGPVESGTGLSHDGRRCGTVLSSVHIDEGHFAWVVINRDIATGAELLSETQTAGTLLRAPASML
jgi:folate-binding protein YgfZ